MFPSRRTIFAVALVAACASALRAETLTSQIDSILSRAPAKGAIWGVDVEDDAGRIVYHASAQTLLAPASVRKLFTAAAVADCMGLDATIPTELWIDGQIVRGELQGNVVLRGNGDPSFGGRYEANRDDALRPFVSALRARGIRAIRGGVVADVSRFGSDVMPPAWEFGDIGTYYAPPVDALAFNENVVGVEVNAEGCPDVGVVTDPAFLREVTHVDCAVDSTVSIFSDDSNTIHVEGGVSKETTEYSPYLVSVRDAGLYAAEALDDLLRREGFAVAQAPAVTRKPRAWSECIAIVQSPPVAELLTTMLQQSQNLYAEMLLKSLAPSSAPATYDAALQTERLDLVAIGIPPGSFRFDDGSGLSGRDLATPAAIVAVLRHLGDEAHRGAFDRILATPGGEGTLRRRLADLAPVLRAKSGTIGGVAALAGWIDGSSGETRYFAIIVNHHTVRASQVNATIDEIVRAIAKF